MEWTNYEEEQTLEKCQNICIPGDTGKNSDNPNFTKNDKIRCDNQELALDERFAGHSSLKNLTIH